MAKSNSSSNIYIKHNEELFKFLNVKIEDKNDGSVYISLVRDGQTETMLVQTTEGVQEQSPEKPRARKKRLSYHATGTVIYHDTIHRSKNFEPVASVTGVNCIAIWSIPGISALDILSTEPKPEDHVVDWFGDNGRATFHIIIAPNNFTPTEPHVSLRYDGLLSVFAVYEPDVNLEGYPDEAFCVFVPDQGFFEKPQMEQKEALIAYHQKVNQTSDLIIYSPNGAGVYKIITAVTMRVPPKVLIEFSNDGYTSEVTKCVENVIEFKVKDRHGAYVKTPVSIKSIALDSEL